MHEHPSPSPELGSAGEKPKNIYESLVTPEKVAPPQDAFEVAENSFAVASPQDGRAYLYTEYLLDCKAIIIRNLDTDTTLMAHLSATSDLSTNVATWIMATSPHDTDPLAVTIVTGSAYDSNRDLDEPVHDQPNLVYPAVSTITNTFNELLTQHGGIPVTHNVVASAEPRSIAVELSTGRIVEVDAMQGTGEPLDTSKNTVIEPMIDQFNEESET